MDETLVWLAWLPEATARIAWARANGATWSDVAALAGLGRRTCQRRLLEGLLAVARRLGRNPPRSGGAGRAKRACRGSPGAVCSAP